MDQIQRLRSLAPEELEFIATRNYGQDAARHLAALKAIAARNGVFPRGENWYPYEVVELTANALEPGHAREFAACTLLVLAAVPRGFDASSDRQAKFADRAVGYDRLTPELRDAVLSAYGLAGR